MSSLAPWLPPVIDFSRKDAGSAILGQCGAKSPLREWPEESIKRGRVQNEKANRQEKNSQIQAAGMQLA